MVHSSILEDVKKFCQVPEWDDGFDTDLIIHINTALMTLNQLGVGPSGGLFISGPEDTWASLVEGNEEIEGVKTYVEIKTKLVFDPPTSSFVLEAMKQTAAELEWRLNVHAEGAFDE